MGRVKRANKHNARREAAVVGGQKCAFDSQAEYRYALWLDHLRRNKLIKSWAHHADTLTITAPNGKRLATMKPDFTVYRRGDPTPYFHEVKGFATGVWRIKRRMLEVLMPGVRYVVIDANMVGDPVTDTPPRLFDERPKRKRRGK